MGNRAAQFRAENGGYPVKRRGRRFIEFDLGAGVTRHVTTIEPLHYGATQSAEVDDGWHVSTGAWQWEMVANDFQLHARDVLNAGSLVEWLDVDTGQTVTVQPLALNWVDSVTNSRQQIALPQAVTAQASDNVLYWPNGYGSGRHFRYTSHPKRLLKELILDSASVLPAPTVSNPWLEIEFLVSKSTGCSYWVDGAAWDNSTQTTTGNRIEVRSNSTGEVLWYFESPVATDANGSTVAGVFQLRRQGQNRYCTVRIPRSWVQSAVFPISLDPTFTDGYGGDVTTAFDTEIKQDAATSNYGTQTGLQAQYNTGGSTHTPLVKFTLTALEGVTITSRTLSLFQSTATGDTVTVYARRILAANSGWTEAGATWNTIDGSTAWAGSNGCATSDTDYASAVMGSLPFAAANGAGYEYTVSLDATEFASMVSANAGIRVLPTTNWTQANFASSDHATTGYRPKLVVEYTSGATRTVDVITAALKATTTRTVDVVTAALAWTRTRTVDAVTAALSLTSTRTADAITAALRATASRTADTVTAALRATASRTVATVTAVLSYAGGGVRTAASLTVALIQGFTRTAATVRAVLSGPIGRPEETISAGNWTAADLWDKVNEP